MTYEEKLTKAALRGADLMIAHGLGDWTVKLTHSVKTLADTNCRDKVIRMSRRFVTVTTQEQFEGVILHEIAHALVGRGHGHDEVFKQKCIEISPNSDYATSSVGINIFNYQLSCDSCGICGGSNRVKSGICVKCNVPLKVTKDHLKLVAWA